MGIIKKALLEEFNKIKHPAKYILLMQSCQIAECVKPKYLVKLRENGCIQSNSRLRHYIKDL